MRRIVSKKSVQRLCAFTSPAVAIATKPAVGLSNKNLIKRSVTFATRFNSLAASRTTHTICSAATMDISAQTSNPLLTVRCNHIDLLPGVYLALYAALNRPRPARFFFAGRALPAVERGPP